MGSARFFINVTLAVVIGITGSIAGADTLNEKEVFGKREDASPESRTFSGGSRTPENFFERMGYDDEEIVITREQIEHFTEAVFAYTPLFHEIRVRSMLGQEDPQELKSEFQSRTKRILSRYELTAQDYAVFDRIAQQMPEFRQYMLKYASKNNFNFEKLEPPESIEGVIKLTQHNTGYDVEELLNPDKEGNGGLPEGFSPEAISGGTVGAVPGGL